MRHMGNSPSGRMTNNNNNNNTNNNNQTTNNFNNNYYVNNNNNATTSTSSTSTASTSTSTSNTSITSSTSDSTSTTSTFNEAALRKKIIAINSDPNLSTNEKSMKVQMLMMPKSFTETSIDPQNYDGDMEPTYFDIKQGILGCKHYRRNCKLKANCCGHLFTCRFCHDDNSNHQIVRYDTKEVWCMKCQTLQPVAPKCSNCNTVFARYFCDYCKFFDDDPDKNIFHCPHCKICRIGRGLEQDYRHCMKCNGCVAIHNYDNHKCIENKFDSDCPICHQYMFNSVSSITIMACGHGIHKKCLQEYARTNYKCPLCAKSLFEKNNMTIWWDLLDREIRLQPMSAEFKTHINKVLCNDCGAKTLTPFHFVGSKCGDCGGYSTTVITRMALDPKDPLPMNLATNHKVRYNDDLQVQAEIRRGRVDGVSEVESEGEEDVD